MGSIWSCWHGHPLLLSFRDLRINLLPFQHCSYPLLFSSKLTCPPPSSLFPHHQLRGQSRCLRWTLLGVQRSQTIANREVLSKPLPAPPRKSIPAPNLIMPRGQSSSGGRSHAARPGPCPLHAHAALQPGFSPAQGKAGGRGGRRGKREL